MIMRVKKLSLCRFQWSNNLVSMCLGNFHVSLTRNMPVVSYMIIEKTENKWKSSSLSFYSSILLVLIVLFWFLNLCFFRSEIEKKRKILWKSLTKKKGVNHLFLPFMFVSAFSFLCYIWFAQILFIFNFFEPSIFLALEYCKGKIYLQSLSFWSCVGGTTVHHHEQVVSSLQLI